MDTAIFNVKLVHFTFLKLCRTLIVFYHYFHNGHCNCLAGDNQNDLSPLKLRTEYLQISERPGIQNLLLAENF